MKSVLVLTEAGSEIGYGHLTRCRSIAAAFRQRGYRTTSLVESDDVALEDNEYLVHWHDPDSIPNSALKEAGIVVFDSYLAGDGIVSMLESSHPCLVAIDDYRRRDYNRGIVVDWTVDAEFNSYPCRKIGVTYALGSAYCALRPPFWTPSGRKFSDVPAGILVTLGGSDIRRLTFPLTASLMKRFPGTPIHAVVGGGVPKSDAYRQLMREGAGVHFDLSPTAMRDLMDRVDLAVSGGGQTLYELANRGLPSVVIDLIDNQAEDILGFSNKGFASRAGRWDAPDLNYSVETRLGELWAVERRESAAKEGLRLVDGQGALRLVAEIERTFEATFR